MVYLNPKPEALGILLAVLIEPLPGALVLLCRCHFCGGELGQIASNVLLAFPFNSVLQEICAGVEMSPRLPSICCVVLKDCASCRRSLLVPGIAKRLASAMQVQPWAGPQKESDHPCSRHSFWLGPRVWFRVLFRLRRHGTLFQLQRYRNKGMLESARR